MTVRVSLHQPNFVPWAKLFDKILASDVYVAYDSVQFTRTEFHARQRIKSRTGPVWLTVPVRTRGQGRPRLCDVRVVEDGGWRAQQLRLFDEHYRRAPFAAEVRALLAGVLGAGDEHLVDLNLRMLDAMLAFVGARVRVVRASGLPHTGDNTARLVALTRAVGGTVHLTSTYGTERRYIDWVRVLDAGLGVESQHFTEPEYPQLHGPFRPGLGVLDLLCALGPAAGAHLAAHRRLEPVTLDDALAVRDGRPPDPARLLDTCGGPA